MILKFIPKINPRVVACGVLVAGLGGMAPLSDAAPAPAATATTHEASVIPVSDWYKNKHWWKKHAPVIGGAAGGGLIGGLAGGGKGALIGGAAGAGGGYVYKRMKDSHHHHGTANRAEQPAPQQPNHVR